MDIIFKNIARTLISTVGTEKIANMAGELIKTVIEEKNKTPLEDPETDCIGIIYEKNGTAFFSQVTINEKTESGNVEIIRYLSVYPVKTLIEKLLKNL